jgi:hypothetical protein
MIYSAAVGNATIRYVAAKRPAGIIDAQGRYPTPLGISIASKSHRNIVVCVSSV